MSIQQYVRLDPTLTSVQAGPFSIDSVYLSTLNVNKRQAYRIVNMIAQPAFNVLTQKVVQNGWTVTANDVQPVWQIVALTQPEIDQNTIASNYQTVMASNVVAAFTNADTNWATLNAAQKDQVLRTLMKVMKALLQQKFGITN